MQTHNVCREPNCQGEGVQQVIGAREIEWLCLGHYKKQAKVARPTFAAPVETPEGEVIAITCAGCNKPAVMPQADAREIASAQAVLLERKWHLIDGAWRCSRCYDDWKDKALRKAAKEGRLVKGQ